jgi:hypothetical protein
MTRVPRVAGLTLAALHLACVAVAATCIIVAFAHGEGESPMLWIYFAYLDYPLGYLFPAVDVTSWPDIQFLPPIANNWDAFLAPLIFFSVVGTSWWFCIGWVLGRIFTLIFKSRGSCSQLI